MGLDKPSDHLPAHVLTRDDFAAACEARDVGTMLGLAKRYGGPGWTASHLARRCELTVSRVGDYVRGRRRATSVEVLTRVVDGLHIPGAMLDLAPRPWEATAPAERAEETEDTVDRRAFLKAAGIAAAGGALSASLPSARRPRPRVGDLALVDAGRERLARLRKLDDHLGGADTFPHYDAEVARSEKLLTDGAMRTDGGRAALLALLAEQTAQAGWAAFDAGRQDAATNLFGRSHAAAREAGSADLAGNALALRSYQLVSTGGSGVESTNRSFAVADRDDVHPVVRSLLYQRGAWTHAVAGDADTVAAALAKAEDALGRSRSVDAPDWAAWVDSQTELDIIAGRCWTRLHRPLRAVPALESALAVYDVTHARDAALYSSWLADAYIDASEPERAADLTGYALDLSVGVASTRPLERVGEVVARLEPYAASAGVAELFARDAVHPLRIGA